MVEQPVAQLNDETFGPDSYNACSYVYNNPINMTDPSGLKVWCKCVYVSNYGPGTAVYVCKVTEAADCNTQEWSSCGGCSAKPIPGGGPHGPLQGGDPGCGRLNAAIGFVNSIINSPGPCKDWFDNHGPTPCGPFDVKVRGSWKLWTFAFPTLTTPFGNTIGFAKSGCDKGGGEITSLLVHELAHHYCPVTSGREECAISAQNACWGQILNFGVGAAPGA